MPVRNEREYRKAAEFRAIEDEGSNYKVVGYATTFNDPYLLFDDGEYRLFEQVDPNAFDEADMSDVIFQYDHDGMVFARQKNGTMSLEIDEHGLKVIADLSKTQASRDMYEAIRSGLVSEMSFAFTVREDSYDKEKQLRSILKIARVFDVSAVSIPANPNTEISARNFANGVIEQMKAERLEQEQLSLEKEKLKLLGGYFND